MGHYCMAKHCVRVFSDIIRRELYDSGIKAITIEPTFFRTQIINFEVHSKVREKIYSETPDEIRNEYDENFIKKLNKTSKIVNLMSHTDINIVIDSMFKAVVKKHPKLFYRCCSYFEVLTLWAASHLPEILLDSGINLILKASK